MKYPKLSPEEKHRRRERLLAGRTPETSMIGSYRGGLARFEKHGTPSTVAGSLAGGNTSAATSVGVHDPVYRTQLSVWANKGHHVRWHVNGSVAKNGAQVEPKANPRCSICIEEGLVAVV